MNPQSLPLEKPIYVLNGPNLNRLGKREPQIYGSTTIEQVEMQCRRAAGERPIAFRQTNHEGQLVDWIHEAIEHGSGIVINPAGYSFTWVAILDALTMFPGPIVELHITNIHRREAMYQRSLVSHSTSMRAGMITASSVCRGRSSRMASRRRSMVEARRTLAARKKLSRVSRRAR